MGIALIAPITLIGAGCGRERGTVAPLDTTTTPAVTAAPAARTAREPAAGPLASGRSVPSLPIISAEHRDALAAAGEPTLHEARGSDGVETTLVLTLGEAKITLARAQWDPDRCEDFSHHYAVVDAAHGLVDARINCHFGEDFWTTEVTAELVALDLATATTTAPWSGAETYTGAMDECTTADGEIAYEVEGDTVWLTQASWASWEPQDPGEPLTPKADCVRAASSDTRTPVAKLQPPR